MSNPTVKVESVDPTKQAAQFSGRPANSYDVNPELKEIVYEIRNSDAFKALALSFDALTIKDTSDRIIKQNEWYSTFNAKKNSKQEMGEQEIIDVQPDMRFPMAYMIYNCVESYTSYDVKNSSTFSLYSQLAYEIIMFNFALLKQDMIMRQPPSQWAEDYDTHPLRRGYIQQIESSNVTMQTALLIEGLATVYEPTRDSVTFIPSYASACYQHDYGRLIPPQLFIIMHNLLAQARTSTPACETLRQLYATTILSIGNAAVTVSNLIGGYFLNGEETNAHKSWVRELIEQTFCPALSRAHQQRPTFALINITPQIYADNLFNIYDLLLAFNEEDFSSNLHFIKTMSSFYDQTTDMQTIPIQFVIEKIAGITTLSHTIETLTLPTWHSLPSPVKELKSASDVKFLTNVSYAKLINFNVLVEYGKETLPYPAPTVPEGFKPNLYMVGPDPYKRDDDPNIYRLFDRNLDTYPDVYFFQPYERNINRASLALTLGLKIVNQEIDSTIVPVPNFNDSLRRNNSCIIQGSIPEPYMKPIIPSTIQENHVSNLERQYNSYQVNGFSLRNGGRNILPIFANNEVVNEIAEIPIPQQTPGFGSSDHAYRQTAWRQTHTTPPIPEKSRFVWSSYRYSTNSDNIAERVVNFYYSMRPYFGTSIPLMRTRNPELLIVKR